MVDQFYSLLDLGLLRWSGLIGADFSFRPACRQDCPGSGTITTILSSPDRAGSTSKRMAKTFGENLYSGAS